MKTNRTNTQRWLYCISGESEKNNIWSRLNLEASGVTWLGNPARGQHTGLLALLTNLPVTSHTDNNNWTSESDALGEWGVVWGL